MEALLHLIHADEVAGHRVALGIGRDLKLELRIDRIRLGAAHVVGAAGAADDGAGGAVLAADLGADGADAGEALAEDDVVGDEVAVHLQPRLHVLHEIARALEEGVVGVVAEAAEPVVAVGQARAAEALEQVEDLLAVVESVQDRREAAEVEEEGAPPDHVAGDAVELGGDDADVLGAGRHLDLGGALDGTHKGVGVVHGREVIDAAGVGQELGVRAVLAHLLVHPVDVADDGLGALDPLAVHGHQHAEDAVRGRVLRAEVEREGLVRRVLRQGGGGDVLGGRHG